MYPATLLILSLITGIQAATVEHWWNISYAEANPDGRFQRRVIGINGSWPPPVVTATEGDTVIIHATNGLQDTSLGTAIHGHGLFFNGSNWYDGAIGVNQCPIPSGETLDYHIDTTGQTGTYWIHGHHNGQAVDGLRTPFIIYPRDGTGRHDALTWDEEFILVMADWYHEEYPVLERRDFLNWVNPTGAEPVPDSAVIYGAWKNGTTFSTPSEISAGTGVSDHASLLFTPGKSYRIHMVNMGGLAMFWVALQDHQVYIIEADGVEVEPLPVDAATFSVAQRYSLWVQAKDTGDRNYALSFMQDTAMYDTVPPLLVLNNTVQVVYNASAPAATAWIPSNIPTFNDTQLVPLHALPLLQPDVKITLNAYFETYDDGTNRASFNNITYQMPSSTPSFLTAMTMGNDSFNPAVYGAQTNVFAYPHHSVVELTVYNWDAGFHPFHLHGHSFQVVHKSFDMTSDDPVINPVAVDEGQKNPARRDTVVIPGGGSIDWHLSSGLAAVLVEAPERFAGEKANVPERIYDHCRAWKMGTEGNVVGTYSVSDFDGQPWGPFPLKMGWTRRAIGALAGCILTALIGMATIGWYASGELDEEEMEAEVRWAANKGKE
nr:acidic laccase [Cryptococcus depauperatus CBS 7855]